VSKLLLELPADFLKRLHEYVVVDNVDLFEIYGVDDFGLIPKQNVPCCLHYLTVCHAVLNAYLGQTLQRVQQLNGFFQQGRTVVRQH
jgi:hypothetical protein